MEKDLLKLKRIPDDFSNDVLSILSKMSFTNLLHLKVMGSGGQKAQVYAGDYDAYEQVPIKSVSSAVAKFQSMIRSLQDTPLTYIGDIKSGSKEEWKVIGDDVRIEGDGVKGYNAVAIKKRVQHLKDTNIITREEYETAMRSLKPRITPLEMLEIKRDLRFNIVRWTPTEVLKGEKRLHDGSIYTLEEAFTAPAITKLDVISWVQGNRFTDFSCIYEFHKGRKLLNKGFDDVERALKENIYALYHEKDYFKMAKRMYALAKFKGAYPLLTALSPMFNGDLGRLYMVYGDLGTLEYLVENWSSLPKQKIAFEIDQFKNRLSNITLPKYLANEPEIVDTIEKMKNLLSHAQNNAQLLRLIRQLKDRLKRYLSHYAFEYLKGHHLIPPPQMLLPTSVSGGVKPKFEGVSEETKAYLTEAGKKKEGQKKSHQQELAQFYTPDALRNMAWETINQPLSSRVLEPSAGSGEWLKDILTKGYTNIIANDYDTEVFNKFKDKWIASGITPSNQDYLVAEFPHKFDLIIGNPPYFLMKGKFAPSAEVKAKFKSVLKGVPDIYGLFVVKAIDDLAPEGVMSFVIPVSLLTSPAFQKMRDFIHKHSNIERITISPKLDWFAGAKVEVMIFQVRKTTPTNDYIAKVGDNIIFVPNKDPTGEAYTGQRLKDLVKIKIGNFDPSKIKGDDKTKLMSGTRTTENLPIIYGENITNEGLVVDKKLKGTRGQYVVNTYMPKAQVEAPLIVMNRTIGKQKKITIALVDKGTYYPENHTIYMKGTPENLAKAYKVLSNKEYQKVWTENVRGHIPTLTAEYLADVPTDA